MKSSAFDNVKDQIGLCGIWCGSCAVGNGALRELTRKYEETISAYGLEQWVPKDFDYGAFSNALSAIQRISSCPGCLKGGGRENCEIRACATEKCLEDCTQCGERAECPHGEILGKMCSGALEAGLFVKTEDADRAELLRKWTAELVTSWPSCLLFLSQTDQGAKGNQDENKHDM